MLPKLDLEFYKVRDIEELIIKYVDSAPIRLKEVAAVISPKIGIDSA